MTQHGIIMSAWSINAYRDGRKTVTRRPVKPKRDRWAQAKAGDGLVFREVWAVTTHFDDDKPLEILPYIERSRDNVYHDSGMEWPLDHWVYFKANGDKDEYMGRWRSPIHLPFALARFKPKIVSIRQERLDDMGNNEAIMEGCLMEWITRDTTITALGSYMTVWKGLYGAWNPEQRVWRIEFEGHKK